MELRCAEGDGQVGGERRIVTVAGEPVYVLDVEPGVIAGIVDGVEGRRDSPRSASEPRLPYVERPMPTMQPRPGGSPPSGHRTEAGKCEAGRKGDGGQRDALPDPDVVGTPRVHHVAQHPHRLALRAVQGDHDDVVGARGLDG